jgi:peptidoglycan/LPS O-acetylase OafA/YrhL
MQVNAIICLVCGFRNSLGMARCDACGAKLESTTWEGDALALQRNAYSWKITFSAALLFVVLELLVLVVLPKSIRSYDPQGMPALMLMIAIWFVASFFVGVVVPGRHLLEPVVAACIVVIPTMIYIAFITPEGFDPSNITYAIAGVVGIMAAMFGVLVGEALRGDLRVRSNI